MDRCIPPLSLSLLVLLQLYAQVTMRVKGVEFARFLDVLMRSFGGSFDYFVPYFFC